MFKEIYFSSIDSTQNYCVNNDLASQTIIITDHQSHGRGQWGKSWHDLGDGGQLMFSAVLDLPAIAPSFFIQVVALKIVLMLNDKYQLDLKIKWPNDVYQNDLKVAGIIADVKSETNQLIIGCGINIIDPHFENASGLFTNVQNLSRVKTEIKDEIITILHALNTDEFDLSNLKEKIIANLIIKQSYIVNGEIFHFSDINELTGAIVLKNNTRTIEVWNSSEIR